MKIFLFALEKGKMKAKKMAHGKEGFPINTLPSGGTTTHKK